MRFSDIFPKRLGIFTPNFTRLLHVPIYAKLGLQIFIQLSAPLTKLRHIKRDHPVHLNMLKMSTIGRNSNLETMSSLDFNEHDTDAEWKQLVGARPILVRPVESHSGARENIIAGPYHPPFCMS